MTSRTKVTGEATDAGGRAGVWRARAWRYGPLLAWAAFICYASTAAMSAAHTSRILGPALRWLFPEISEEGLALAHFAVRKLAHLAEYGLLALLAARAFLTSSKEFLRLRWAACALGLVVCLALADELNQSFTPSRGGSVWDSLLDTAGGASALAAFALLRSRGRRGRR